MTDTNSGFDPVFEEKIIQAILGDPVFGEQILEVLEPDFFDLDHTKHITTLLLDYYRSYETFPSVSLIKSICESEIKSPILKKKCLGYVDKMQAKPLNGDSQYVKDKSLMFFRTQAVKNALLNEVIPKIQKENLEEILPIIQNAINKGISRDVGFEYKEDAEVRFVENKFAKVPTPWGFLNKLLHGGWEPKRLITFIGASGAGKSHLLVDTGAGALLAPKEDGTGRTIIHYTLELSEIDVARRYDAFLTGVEINNVPQNREKILATLKNKLPKDCHLIIKEYPMWSASIQTIKAHLSRLRLKDIVPDLIVIDYGDLLSPLEANKKEDRPTSSIWGNMKTLAQELDIPIVTATQSNREGFNQEVITLDKVADDFKKVMHSDVIITLARNMEQKQTGYGKMYMGKNRQGEDGIIYGYTINTKKSLIDMYELTEEKEEEIAEALQNMKAKTLTNDVDSLEKFLKKKRGATADE